jgi:hypothetical protein
MRYIKIKRRALQIEKPSGEFKPASPSAIAQEENFSQADHAAWGGMYKNHNALFFCVVKFKI